MKHALGTIGLFALALAGWATMAAGVARGAEGGGPCALQPHANGPTPQAGHPPAALTSGAPAGASGRAADAGLLGGGSWRMSTDGGQTFDAGPLSVAPGQAAAVVAECTFTVEDPPACAALELCHQLAYGSNPQLALNNQAIAGELDGVFYQTIRGIDAGLLRAGTNTLRARFDLRNDSAEAMAVDLAMQLWPRWPADLRIQTGPIIGAVDEDSLSVALRTSMAAEVELHLYAGPAVGEPFATVRSPSALTHRLRAVGLRGRDRVWHEVRASAASGGGDQRTPRRCLTLPPFDALRLVAMGDSRTNPADWAAVAASARRARPHLVVFAGDMVGDGRIDRQWDEEFVNPASDLLAEVPFYAVIGNHEAASPLCRDLFHTPTADGRGANWFQRFGGVALIGIDGAVGWDAASDNVRWLQSVLESCADAKFIFLVSHYPAWSSSVHGGLNEGGQPAEAQVGWGQQAIMPLLARFGATAMIAGHDHNYQRSEPPGGVTMLVTGGAGAPRYPKVEDAERQNPHLAVFAAELHFCLFEVARDTCTLTALRPDGTILDTRTWAARPGAE